MTEAGCDIVILSADSGGYAATLRAAQFGMEVTLVEGDKVGGTYLHRGRIPAKACLRAAETADTMHESEAFGVLSNLQGIGMAKVDAYRDSVITKLYRGLQELLSSHKVEIVSGWGRLVSENGIEVNGHALTGRNIVLAAGSYSRSFPGLEIGGRVISSDQTLQIGWVPRSAVILGGGVIGLEFVSAWHFFGAEVVIIEALPHLANNEDEAVPKQLERAYRKHGITFHTNTRFSGAAQDENGVHVSTETGKTLDANVLLVTVGRGPVTQGLGYEEAGIRVDHGFVPVDGRLRTDISLIRAIGGIVPGSQFAHRGFPQGIFVAEDIADLNPTVIDESEIPRMTFCEPEIASVGLTERAAREKCGDAVRTVEYNLVGNGRSNTLGTAGFIKLVSVENGPIVGFHGTGPRTDEQIDEGELIVDWEAYPSDVVSLIRAHPSQNESIDEATVAPASEPLHAHN